MEANCASSCFEEQATEEFCFEVPITNVNNKRSPANVLYGNNHVNTKTSKTITNSESIAIEETDDKIIKAIEIEIAALDEGINNEIINNNHKRQEIGTTIDLDETDNVAVCQTDSDVIVLDGNKTDSDVTIILNDDEINNFTKENDAHNVIDVEKDTDCSIVESSVNIDNGTKNGVLTELIEKCLSMKNSEGMSRVINRTLLVLYKDIDEGYKKSDEFRKLISDTITQLNVEPERKFSHIKNLCDNMKQHKTKKRVPFITLDKDKDQSTSIPKKRRKVDDIIDLDDDTNVPQSNGNSKNSKNIYPIGKVYPSIDLDSSDEDVISQEDEVILVNKENRETENAKTLKNTKKKTVKNNRTVENTRKHKKLRKIESKAKKRALRLAKQNKNNLSLSDPGMLLEPRMSVGVEITESNQAKINSIERKIARYKYQLEILEEAEVLTDTTTSPYVTCERIKTIILKLYRELCQLTGTEVTKRHEVRLQVVPGHPEGPVRVLEDFLNGNIDEDGNPPFPDMVDVLNCVIRANSQYNLCWAPSQVMNEAQALFTQFGQSMQKRRQQREWKDLMSLVKQEVIDPADEDPALLARLEDNKIIAKRNELDLLDRYAKMEHGIYPTSNPGLRLKVNESEESDDDSDITEPDTNLQISPTDMTPSEKLDQNDLATTNEDMVDRLRITNISGNGLISTANQISRTDMTPTEKLDENYLATANEDMVDRLRITNISGNGVISTANQIVGNIHNKSIVSICGGNIVIQPMNQQSENTCKLQAVNTHFETEYNKFLDTRNKPNPSVKNLPRNRVSRMSIETENSAIQRVECNETDLEMIAKVAENIISLVRSEQGTDLANDKLTNDTRLNHVNNTISFNPAVSLVQSNQGTDLTIGKLNHANNVISFNPTVQLTKLNLKDLENKTTTIFVHSALMACNSNAGCVSSDIVTHQKDVNTNKDVQSEEINKDSEIGSNVLEKENEMTVEDVESIVKPEPLDIPKLLEELGEGYTATIFDIEDPFLVIEISDSSESEDENDLENA